jgi:aryl carrier-like protein
LGEIETGLLQHPDVRMAAVTAAGEERGNKRLVAYVVPAQHLINADNGKQEALASDQSRISSTAAAATDSRLDGQFAESLKDFLRGKLPEYMVPASFVILKSLPLSNNGKVDRKALPKPESAELKTAAARVEPRTEIERVLAGIWQALLGVDSIGVNENFFELGGDSVKAIQIVARANQLGLQLSPRHIFEHPTVAELGTAIGANRDTRAPSVKPISRQVRQVAQRPAG